MPPPARRPFRWQALLILWPAFVMAGVLEMLVFAVLDPSTMRWFGAEPIEWSRTAVYVGDLPHFLGCHCDGGGDHGLARRAGAGDVAQPFAPFNSFSNAAWSRMRICRCRTCSTPSSWNFEKQRLTVSSFKPR
jgi:hypothetical protein